MAAMVQPLRVASRAAQILIASGSPAQASSSSAVASGSAAARSSPTTLTNSFSASSSSSTLRSTSRVLARSGIRLRVVTSTADDAVPGSSGRTWAASRALSSTTSIRRPASVVRYLAARSASSTGMSRPSTPRSRRNRASTSPGGTGFGVAPSRSTYSCPSGKLPPDAVGGVHRQRGLAEPARAGHHRDADRAGVAARRLARVRSSSPAASPARRGR